MQTYGEFSGVLIITFSLVVLKVFSTTIMEMIGRGYILMILLRNQYGEHGAMINMSLLSRTLVLTQEFGKANKK